MAWHSNASLHGTFLDLALSADGDLPGPAGGFQVGRRSVDEIPDVRDAGGQRDVFSSVAVSIPGEAPGLEVRDCRICLAGEFSGKVDVTLSCGEEGAERLLRRLTLRVPGEPEPLTVFSSGRGERGFEFGFAAETLADCGKLPEQVTLCCDGKDVAVLPFRLTESVPFDQGRYIDPDPSGMTPSAESFRTRRLRGPVLSGLGLTLLGAGSWLVAHAVHSERWDPTSAGFATGLILAVFGMIALAAMIWPYRYIRIDPLQRTVSDVRGRDIFWHSRVIAEARRSSDEFSHVRVVDSGFTDSDGDSHERWTVTLEGPIAWQDETGVVNARSDALRLGNFGTNRAAHDFAARVAVALGLRILDSSTTGA